MIFALTGGIGSGKSSVLDVLSQMGMECINADNIADNVRDDPKIKQWIVDNFGAEYIDEWGRVDRKKLGSLVFNDKNKLEALSAQMRPLICDRICEAINSARKRNVNLVVEIALLFEFAWDSLFDKVIVVVADKAIRKQRVKDRDGRSEEEIENIMNTQLHSYETPSNAIIIENNGGWEDMKAQVKEKVGVTMK